MGFLTTDDKKDKTIKTMVQAESETHIATVFADILVDAGIEFVFGMPGGNTPFMFDGLFDQKEKINTITTKSNFFI